MKTHSMLVILALTSSASAMSVNAKENKENRYFIGFKHGNTIFTDAKSPKIRHWDIAEGWSSHPDSPSGADFDEVSTTSINIGKNVYQHGSHSIDMYGFYDLGGSTFTSLKDRSETKRHIDNFGLGGKYKYSISATLYSFAGLEVGHYKDTLKHKAITECSNSSYCYETEKSQTSKSGLMTAAFIGAGVNLNEDVDVELGLRHQRLNKNKYDDEFDFKKSNQIYLGLNYHF